MAKFIEIGHEIADLATLVCQALPDLHETFTVRLVDSQTFRALVPKMEEAFS